jgi:sugar lactone lactonase YvrE/fibronectin type 3 domain-containing protein
MKAVFSVKGANDVVYSDTMLVRIMPKDTAGPPSAPRNVRLSYDTLKQIVTLVWSPNHEKDVTGYDIFRSTVDSATIYSRINNTVLSDTSYIDTTTVLSHTYSYRIAAKDAGGLTGTMSLAVQMVSVPHPTVTTAFSITYDTLNETVHLHLRKPDTAYIQGYVIYRRDVAAAAGYTRTTTTPIADTLVSNSGLTENKTYEYRLAIIAKDGLMGKMGGAHTVLIVPAIQQAPVVNLSYDILKQIVTLTWSRADTALVQGYNVYRQHVDSGLVKINMAVVNDTIYRDSTVLQDNSYTFQVKAVDKSGNEGPLSVGVGVEVVSAFVLLDSIGVTGTGVGQFIEPHGISVDIGGNIYIVDAGNKRILKFSHEGVFLSSIQVALPTSSSFIANDVAIDSNFNIFMTEGQEKNEVFKFDSLGNAIDTIGSLSKPKGIFISTEQELYVADANNNRIMKFNLHGDSLMSFGSSGSQNGQFNTPLDIVVDSVGNIYVSDANNRIQKFDPNGSFIKAWGSYGTSIGSFDWPISLAMDSKGNLFVADYHNSRIQMFDTEGGFILEILMSNAQDRSRPAGIAFDSADFLYVSDDSGSNFSVLKFGKR